MIFLIAAVVQLLSVSYSLRPHRWQRTKPPCPSSSAKVCPDSCPLHWWCHPAISSSDTLFCFCPQSSPVSGTFPLSWPFATDDQNTGVLASASVLPMSIQGWFPLSLTGLISMSRGLSGVFSSTTVQRHQFFGILPSLQFTLTTGHNHWEGHNLDSMDLVSRVMCLLFNTLSRFVIAFLPISNCILILWSTSSGILELKKRKCTTFSSSICHKVMGSGRRQWHPSPILLPGKSHRRRSLVGCSPWGP